MRSFTLLRAAIPALCIALPLGAQTRVDFNQYASPTTTEYQATIGAPLTAGPVDIYYASAFNSLNSDAIGTFGTSDPASVNRPSNIGGSTTMFGTSLGGRFVMVGSGADVVFGTYAPEFGLVSLDVSHLYSSAYSPIALAPINLTFYGLAPGATSYFTQSFTIPVPPTVNGVKTPQLQTLAFDSRFADVTEVDWFQGNGSGTAHQFTNLVVTTPEPSSLVLFGTGLSGLLGVAARRRRRSV